MAGLDAIDRRIAPQQRIAVVLGDAVPLEFLDRVDFVFLGIIVDQRARQQRDVVRGRVLVRRGQAGRIDVMRAGHAELLRVLVHERGEGLLGTGDVFGQRDRRVVARLDDHAVHQILERHFGVELEEAGRTVRARPTAAPGVFADVDLVLHLDLARGELGRDDIGSHHFGDRSRLDARVDIVAGEHLAAGVVHQHPALRVELRLRRHGHVERVRAGHRRGRLHRQVLRGGVLGFLLGLLVFLRLLLRLLLPMFGARLARCGDDQRRGNANTQCRFLEQLQILHFSKYSIQADLPRHGGSRNADKPALKQGILHVKAECDDLHTEKPIFNHRRPRAARRGRAPAPSASARRPRPRRAAARCARAAPVGRSRCLRPHPPHRVGRCATSPRHARR